MQIGMHVGMYIGMYIGCGEMECKQRQARDRHFFLAEDGEAVDTSVQPVRQTQRPSAERRRFDEGAERRRPVHGGVAPDLFIWPTREAEVLNLDTPGVGFDEDVGE